MEKDHELSIKDLVGEAVKGTMEKLDVQVVLNHWRPWSVLAGKHDNGTWSLGWWKKDGEWLWWNGKESLRGRGS